MNPREKKLLGGVVAALVVAAVVWKFTGDTAPDSPATGAEDAQKTFKTYYQALQDGPWIRKAYERVNTPLMEIQPGSTPEATFSDEVFHLLQNKGWEFPKIKPAKKSDIPGVEDYFYIDLDVTLQGTLQKITNVMLDLQSNGLMIKTFKIEKRNMDVDQVDLDLTVSRLGKDVEEEKPVRRSSRSRRR